ncbi:MAG: hypothetical protein HYX76_10965 [Acidobacteria bacterium]|nr:hypothetical protein [Acidobacteriota bacterium]
MRIVIAGYMVRNPLAGNLFAFFHYLAGLCRLGHELVYVEESGWPYSSYDPILRRQVEFPERGLAIVRDMLRRYGLAVPVCWVDRETGRTDGTSREALVTALQKADLFLNIGGVCWLSEFQACRRRILIDMDPLFTQLGEFAGKVLGDYDVLFTYGANIGKPNCRIPTGQYRWHPTVPPVVTDFWKRGGDASNAPFSTVASWNAYKVLHHDGERYGQKDEEFLRILSLPSRTRHPLELALAGGEDIRPMLAAAGWRIRDAAEVATVERYQDYITSSRGELSAAKQAYVRSWSGWFSDRSVCYLAAGRPVVLQDTGFTDWLGAGEGALAFSDVEQAAACLERVNADYDHHRRAARALAESVFGHDVVLPSLLERAMDSAVAGTSVRL